MILFLPWIPLAGALVILAVSKEKRSVLSNIAIACCSVSFAISVYYFFVYDTGLGGYQFVKRFPWIPSLGVEYVVGLDGINLTFCLLHALVSLAGVFVAVQTKDRLKEYLFYYLILTGAIYGVFSCLDLFFLYIFYETTLIPLFPMIGIWGSKNKSYGAMKLTLFITAGAMLALFALIVFYQRAGLSTFNLILIQDHFAQGSPFSERFQTLLAPFLLLGFGVIASLWPLHSWSPIGYAAAPTSVSMLHAGVLKKMGPYLMIRIAIAFLPAGVAQWSGVLAVLAGIGIIYAGLAAIWQKDLKFMVGFSSVSHMGYVLLALAALNTVSVSGAVLLMFSHGVMAACMFALIGYLYERTHVRDISDFGGLAQQTPFVSMCFIMASLASLGLPGFSNFASELLVFLGSWNRFPILVCLAVVGILITAVYLLRAVQKVCYGEPNPRWPHLKDAQGFKEKFPFVLLLGALLLFGFWPNGLLNVIRPAVSSILAQGGF